MRLVQLFASRDRSSSHRFAAWSTCLRVKARRSGRRILIALMVSVVGASLAPPPLQAQTAPYCQQSQAAIDQKEVLRQVSAKGNQDAQKRYATMIKQHAAALRACRRQAWAQSEAIWIRLYPCDIKSGALEAVLIALSIEATTRSM